MARTDVFDDSDLDLTEEVAAPEAETVATEAPAETKADTQADKDAEQLPKVEAFKTAVNEAVEAADETTGTVAEAGLDASANAYREVRGIKYKNLASKWLQEQMAAAIKAGQFNQAVSYNEVNEHLQNAAPASAASAPKADPKETFANRLGAIQLAVELLEANVPEEAADYEPVDYSSEYEQAQAHIDWAALPEAERGEEPELSPIAQAALKVYAGKGLGARSVRKSGQPSVAQYGGPRRSVANHIESAFAVVESGTFLKISDIAAHRSEEYGEDAPSSGAISARLFPGNNKPCTIPGVIPGVDENEVKGATKA